MKINKGDKVRFIGQKDVWEACDGSHYNNQIYVLHPTGFRIVTETKKLELVIPKKPKELTMYFAIDDDFGTESVRTTRAFACRKAFEQYLKEENIEHWTIKKVRHKVYL